MSELMKLKEEMGTDSDSIDVSERGYGIIGRWRITVATLSTI